MNSPGLSVPQQFLAAVEAGDLLRIRYLLANGADANLPTAGAGGETPLIRAVAAGQLSVVQLLLEAGANPNLAQKGSKFFTPLMFACEKPAIIRELIAAGANVNARTPLHEIISPVSGRKRLCGGETALHLAAAANNAEAVKALAQAGEDLETGAENGRAPLDYALRTGSITQAAEALVEAGAQLTSQRLEAMHAGAHDPDSDLLQFTFRTNEEFGAQQGQTNPASGRPHEPSPAASAPGTAQQPEFECPKCGALLYSHKPRICGQCGAALPAELLQTDEQAQALQEQRRWARELANAFDTTGTAETPPGQSSAAQPPGEIVAAGSLSPQELLRRASFAQEFRNRERPDFWLYALGYGFMLCAFVFLFIVVPGVPPMALAPIAVLLALSSWRARHGVTPICPNCKRNIRFCPAVYCHICGERLIHQRCAHCDVDNSWTSYFRPYANLGNFRWIAYCPACGVGLDSKIPRWRPGRGG